MLQRLQMICPSNFKRISGERTFLRWDGAELVESLMLFTFEFMSRSIVVHLNSTGNLAATDYHSGVLVAQDKDLFALQKSAEAFINEAFNKALRGQFDWLSFPKINDPAYIQGMRAGIKLKEKSSIYLDGLQYGMKNEDAVRFKK